MRLLRAGLLLSCFFALFLVQMRFFSRAQGANLSNVRIILSTPRLSFSGLLNGSNVVGTSVVNLQTTAGAAPSTSSANLFAGDAILIGSSQYQVASPSSTGSFYISAHPSTPTISTLQAGDADLNDPVIVTRPTTLTANFTTVSAVNNGKFRILVPAASANASDGIPDQTGWDYGTGTVTVTCPDDLSSGGDDYDFGAGVPSASSIVRDGRTYHSFVCTYTGTGGVGTTFDTTNKQFVISSLINPAPAVGHVEGFADTYGIIVEHLASDDSIIDSSHARVAVIESVRITASVAPQITFRIVGVNSGTTVCGLSTSVATTPTLVPLGELSVDMFRSAAHQLILSTNANNGYSVTAIEDDQLRRTGANCAGDASSGGCIPDATGDNATMSHTVFDRWLNTTTKGFGYTMQNNTAANIAFQHNTGTGTCDGTPGNCHRQFADQEDAQLPVEIFSSATVANEESAYVCYKAVISLIQEAGTDYATAVTYRATASF